MVKNDSKIQKISKIFENIQTLPIGSECIPMGPNRSESLKKLAKTSKTCENFEKLRKNFEKLREKFCKNFFHGVVVYCF